MPNLEPVVLSAQPVELRLIGLPSVIWPGMATPPSQQVTVLSKTLTARPLPSSELADSPDLVSGSYTTRLGDAGECAFIYPNAISSDGVPWRTRFDPTGHLMFLEVWLGGELEQVCVIDTAMPSDGAGFSQTLDATDFASSLQGNGAGFQNGTVGQLQALVYDPATLMGALFDVQGWQDFSDASFQSLLMALLNSALGLRLTLWQLLSADGATGGQGQVAVHGQDGWFLLKKAYERDWTVVQSPRDVIERGTQVWVPVTADDFPSGSLSSQWSNVSAGTGTVAISPSGGLLMNTGSNGTAEIETAAISVARTGVWRAVATVQNSNVLTAPGESFRFEVFESTGDQYFVLVGADSATTPGSYFGGTAFSTVPQYVQIPSSSSYTLLLESDGEWVWGFVNGQFAGILRRNSPTTTSLRTDLLLSEALTPPDGVATVTGVLTEAMQPFLERGADKGDYVLPGPVSTYPSGGLHARYYNDTDLQSDANRLAKILAPSRSQAYAGSGAPEYQNQQDATINNQANPMSGGAATGNWSAKYFGAVYLKLSQGDYGLQLESPTGTGYFSAARVWVGKTQWGQQLVDQWAWQNGNANWPFTVSASALAGNPGYGGTPVARDGWYPIVIEYAVDSASGSPGLAPILIFTNVPGAGYTDPGGTAIAGGAQTTVIPATSLSPLGCVDQRYQAIAHFDLVQQTVQAYGYQAAVEPKQLESGLFPGVLAPRVREGKDTDVILVPDKDARSDAQTALLRPRLANTWPLPGSLLPMRFRPGDGVRARDPDIGVWDKVPRQILAFTRNLLPDGISGAVASLANRPRGAAHALKQQLYAATRIQRNYQRQLVTLSGNLVQAVSLGPGASSAGSNLALLPTDQVIRARVRILTVSTGGASFNLLVNGIDVTTALKGPWTTGPVNLDVSGFAATDPSGRMYAQAQNNGAGTVAEVDVQLFVDVMR